MIFQLNMIHFSLRLEFNGKAFNCFTGHLHGNRTVYVATPAYLRCSTFPADLALTNSFNAIPPIQVVTIKT